MKHRSTTLEKRQANEIFNLHADVENAKNCATTESNLRKKTDEKLVVASQQLKLVESRMHDAQIILGSIILEHFPGKQARKHCEECNQAMTVVDQHDTPIARVLRQVNTILIGSPRGEDMTDHRYREIHRTLNNTVGGY